MTDNSPSHYSPLSSKKNIFCYIYIRLTRVSVINIIENGNTVFGRLSSIID